MLKNTFFLINIWLFQKKVVTLRDFYRFYKGALWKTIAVHGVN